MLEQNRGSVSRKSDQCKQLQMFKFCEKFIRENSENFVAKFCKILCKDNAKFCKKIWGKIRTPSAKYCKIFVK